MAILRHLVDVLVHLDRYLGVAVRDYGGWIYLIFFVVVFCETGLVVTPFLPGDSLLFAAGAVAGMGVLSVWWISAVFLVAAVLGNTVNFWVGQFLGPRLVAARGGRLIKREHLERTHAFYERHGAKTIVITRFVPILRTIAPFVAGLGRMTYGRFMAYNVLGGALWVVVGVFSGYLFGNVPLVKQNFSLVILAIVVVSLLPAAVELLRARRRAPAGGGDQVV